MLIRQTFPILMVLALSACYMQARFQDVTNDPKYQPVAYKKLIANSELRIHGITLDRNYAPTLSYYEVTSLPGIGGPEILSKATLPIGTTMQVMSVEQCINCPLDNRIEIVVRLISNTGYSAAPIRVHYEVFTSGDLSVSTQ